MPTYEYLCKHCGQLKDIQRGFNEAEQPVNCDCGKQMYRHYSSPAITFNGPGFYKTGG